MMKQYPGLFNWQSRALAKVVTWLFVNKITWSSEWILMRFSGYIKNGPCWGFRRDGDLWSSKDHRPMVSAISECFSSWASCSSACQVKVYCSYSTCAEGNGVHKCAWDLLCRSLVPQREVIGIKHTLFVLRCQEISEEGQRMKLSHKGLHSSSVMKAVSND